MAKRKQLNGWQNIRASSLQPGSATNLGNENFYSTGYFPCLTAASRHLAINQHNRHSPVLVQGETLLAWTRNWKLGCRFCARITLPFRIVFCETFYAKSLKLRPGSRRPDEEIRLKRVLILRKVHGCYSLLFGNRALPRLSAVAAVVVGSLFLPAAILVDYWLAIDCPGVMIFAQIVTESPHLAAGCSGVLVVNTKRNISFLLNITSANHGTRSSPFPASSRLWVMW